MCASHFVCQVHMRGKKVFNKKLAAMERDPKSLDTKDSSRPLEQCPKSLDTKDSPRPLRDPYAPIPDMRGKNVFNKKLAAMERCPKSLDTKNSPRPLRDPYAPRPEGSSIHGYYAGDEGQSYATSSARASPGSYQSLSDVEGAEETMGPHALPEVSH